MGRLTADIVAADATSVVDPAVLSARRQAAEARRKIYPHLAALEAGLDHALVAERTRHAQAQLTAAEAVLALAPAAPGPLTAAEVIATLDAVRALQVLLDSADPEVRAGVYKSLGISLRYRREEKHKFVRVEAALKCVDLDRVGGGTPSVDGWRVRPWSTHPGDGAE